MTANFVNIRTFFNNEEERTIGTLSKYYFNIEYLATVVKEIMQPLLANPDSLRGKKILLKPNWVLQNRNQDDEYCLKTHDNLILVVLETILKFEPLSVLIADAPVQGCNWEKMLSETFIDRVSHLVTKYGTTISIKDLRRRTFDPSKNNPETDNNPLSEYVVFDLGEQSMLETISNPDKNIFRVTNYNPDRLAESHTKGKHKYCITKELFDADIIISLPKLKTHQKTGITAALKNLVGLNGDKDFLPHHRIGGNGLGGDCYPGKNYLRYWAELLLDGANRNQATWKYHPLMFASAVLWKLSFPKSVHQLAAGWYGNDTTWRMVMDLNKIAVFGKPDGSISNVSQRQIYSLGDGIVGGQGDGPLRPRPLPLGILTFSDNPGLHDAAICKIMGFRIDKIPLVNFAYHQLTGNYEIRLDDKLLEMNDLSSIKIDAIPPSGWISYLKLSE